VSSRLHKCLCWQQLFIMFKKETVFITILFPDIPGIFDYPKHLPIPQKDDEVHLNGRFGKVETVKHMTQGSVTEIQIKCTRL